MKTFYANLSFVLVFMAFSLSAAIAADREARLSKYQNEIKSRESGVYEIDGDLYVNVRIAVKNSAQISRTKLKAVLDANNLLKKWAIDYSAAARNKADDAPEGVKFAASVADACNTGWRFNDWNIKFNGQEVSPYENGFFLLCQIAAKEDVVKQIPPSFSQVIPQNLLFKVLPPFIREMHDRDAAKLYAMCSAIDLMPDVAVSPKAKDEFAKVNADLGKYLASSDFIAGLRARAKKIRGPVVVESWEDVSGSQTEDVSNSYSVVTNVIANVNVATNVVTRAQSVEERKSTGCSAKGEVKETTRISDEAEIVETRTVTSATTIRKIRRKTVREVQGTPIFEDVFVSGGKALGMASPQTEVGKKAVAAYFDAVTPMDDKSKMVADALCENPGDSQLWNLYGRCLLQKNEKMAALVCFRCAARLDSTNQYAITNLSSVYDDLGYAELACGLAVIAYGITDDEWCRNTAKKVLLK